MDKLKQIFTRIGIPVGLGVGAIVRLWVAFREGGIIKLLIKIFKRLTNKFRQFCKWTFCDGQFKSIVASVVIFIIVYISVNRWFVSDSYREKQMVELVRNGLFGIGALIGLWIAYQRSDAMQKQAKIANQQADIAEKRYASEQFSQSVTLLAKDNKDKPAIEARIGGVYALAQLAEADPEGYGARVMKALVAYIRNNAQLTALPVPSKKDKSKSTTVPEERSEAAHLGEDVKTAFAELKRLHSNEKVRDESKVSPKDLSFSHADFRALRLNEVEWIEKPDLSHANLSGADLSLARLQDANLNGANLQGAGLMSAKLQGAILSWANLQGANLSWANLQGTYLGLAKLQGVHLDKANLQGAHLWQTKLQGAYFEEANLQGAYLGLAKLQDAILQGANLQGADLSHADLQGADFIKAKAIYTAFEDAIFDKSTAFDDSVKKWKVWHSNNSFWDSCRETEGFESLEKDVKWNLDFLKEIGTYDLGFALEGILRNFVERGDNKPGSRAIECSKAVKQWVEKHDLWEKLNDYWRDWLKNLDDEGRAPGDEGYASDDK